jgi:hypothetical protein
MKCFCGCGLPNHVVLSSVNFGADAMAFPARWTHAALPQRCSSADPAAKRQNNRKSVARSESAMKSEVVLFMLGRWLQHTSSVAMDEGETL